MFNQKPKGVGVMIAMEPPRLGTPGKQREQSPHEAAEPPAEEQREEYGAKLLNDMISPLVDLGLSEEDAKATLAQILEAAAKCLKGGGESGDVNESDTEDYPA